MTNITVKTVMKAPWHTYTFYKSKQKKSITSNIAYGSVKTSLKAKQTIYIKGHAFIFIHFI